MKPRSALRRISAAPTSGSSEVRHLARDDAVGVRAGPLLEVPVVPRPDGRERELGIARAQLQALARRSPGRNDGKQSDAYTPLRSMSWMRASMSHAPRRISSKRVGSKLYSLTGRPTTALNPTFGNSLPVVDPRLAAVVAFDDVRRVGRRAAPARAPRTCRAARRCGRRRKRRRTGGSGARARAGRSPRPMPACRRR